MSGWKRELQKAIDLAKYYAKHYEQEKMTMLRFLDIVSILKRGFK
jgi:hypothetical protein